MSDDKRPAFDPDLSRHSPVNQEAARVRNIHYSKRRKQYIDEDGCPTHDRFGQRI